MIGGKRLAQQAGVEGIHRLVGHSLEPAVSLVVNLAGDRNALVYLRLVGYQRNLYFIDDRRVIGEQFRVKNLAVIL
jgi:hypothetical protein